MTIRRSSLGWSGFCLMAAVDLWSHSSSSLRESLLASLTFSKPAEKRSELSVGIQCSSLTCSLCWLAVWTNWPNLFPSEALINLRLLWCHAPQRKAAGDYFSCGSSLPLYEGIWADWFSASLRVPLIKVFTPWCLHILSNEWPSPPLISFRSLPTECTYCWKFFILNAAACKTDQTLTSAAELDRFIFLVGIFFKKKHCFISIFRFLNAEQNFCIYRMNPLDTVEMKCWGSLTENVALNPELDRLLPDLFLLHSEGIPS